MRVIGNLPLRHGAGHMIAWIGARIGSFFSLGTLDPLSDTVSDGDAVLLAEVETALASKSYGSKFSALVEERFQRSTAGPRGRLFIRCALLGMIVYNLFLFIDMVTVPDVIWLAVPLQLGLVTPVVLSYIVAIRRFGVDAEAASFICLTLMVAVTLTMFMASRSPDAAIFACIFVLFLMSGNVALAMGFGTSLIFTILHLVAVSTAILLHPVLDTAERVFAIALLVSTANYSLAGSYRIDAGSRSAYLFALRESLRARLLDVSNRALKTLVAIDGLTGIGNRRHLDEILAELWRAQGRDREIAFLLVDIDHFKRFNDDFGHQTGDECLRRVAQALAEETRADGATLARYGGEEFAVAVPGLPLAGAIALAERLRRTVERLTIPTDAGDQLTVTISIGCATATTASAEDPTALIAAADAALYEAKHAGRNRVGIAGFAEAAPALPAPAAEQRKRA